MVKEKFEKPLTPHPQLLRSTQDRLLSRREKGTLPKSGAMHFLLEKCVFIEI
jgi:hypothetical protein